MRTILAIAIILALPACASTGVDGAITAAETANVGSVTYFDRNTDGIADFELHEPDHCDDCDWALVDTDFNGRFDRRIRWSFAIHKEPVDLPVPRNLPLRAGQPPLSGWSD